MLPTVFQIIGAANFEEKYF